ncbi:hypothetical protein JNO12_12875 [Erwinia aphidicola]|nr:hypothetical protein [Erwinia aphidicola]
MADTVTVACMLPNGIVIDINGQQVELKGANSAQIIGVPSSYGLTEGVDKEGFEKFLKDYAEVPFVKNGIVFSQANKAKAEAAAEEKAGSVKTGLEGLSSEAIKSSGVVKDDGK